MQKKICGIYKITNKINNKSYIGQSIDIYRRWKEHKNRFQNNQSPLYNSMRKYGLENFIFEILEECSKEDLNNREDYWMKATDSLLPNGYNQQKAGEYHYKGFGPREYDYVFLAEKYKELNSVYKVADEVQCDWKTVVKACKENGIKLKNSSAKKIAKLNIETGKIIDIYDSIYSVYKEMNKIPNSAISAVCNGKRNSAYGYKWKFIEEDLLDT